MDRNNLTALLTALAVIPLYFKEPSQPAPEKWELAQSYISDNSELEGYYMIISSSPHNGTTARQEPSGKWITCQGSKVLSRHDRETEAWGALYDVLREAERAILQQGFEPFQVDNTRSSRHVHYRRRVQ